jgi:hypothetical protein
MFVIPNTQETMMPQHISDGWLPKSEGAYGVCQLYTCEYQLQASVLVHCSLSCDTVQSYWLLPAFQMNVQLQLQCI